MEKLPFLACLVNHDNNDLRTTVYTKSTHTDRLLHNHPTTQPHTKTMKTLTRLAQLACDTLGSLRDENRYLESAFHENNNSYFITRNI